MNFLIQIAVICVSIFPMLSLTHSTIENRKLYVNGKRFHIKGVAYSPVPMGESPIYSTPHGDYFGLDKYQSLWERDFPKMKEMGVNTVRVYTWLPQYNHTKFLDTADKYELKVMPTFYVGTAEESPIKTAESRNSTISVFAGQVQMYSNHPAILGWIFGNELNGVWNGFLTAFSEVYGCNWDPRPFPDGCYYNPFPWDKCTSSRKCTYSHFFQWIEEAANAAKLMMNPENMQLVFSSFADVDDLTRTVIENEKYVPSMDAWGLQIYRGKTFGGKGHNILEQMRWFSDKPIVITEYGVDAYNDACGVCDGRDCPSPCFNTLQNETPGSGEDQVAHSEWNGNLTKEIMSYQNYGTVGSFIMSWVDEIWKTNVNVKGCPFPYPDASFNASNCAWKAHINCPNTNLNDYSICGYWLESPFDKYVNEGWFGINSVKKANSSDDVDSIIPRKLFYNLQKIWNGISSLETYRYE